MNELALFTGAGGGLLASRWLLRWRTVCAVEIEPYRRELLLRRQRDGLLELFPIWDDIRSFNAEQWHGKVDIVTGGFPCQPFSVAGKQKGADDERNMWPETIRIICMVRPCYAFLENVPGLISCGHLGTVLGDLADAGYDAEWCVLGADDVGAPHRRKRIWILAHTNKIRCHSWGAGESLPRNRLDGETRQMAYTSQANDSQWDREKESGQVQFRRSGWWDAEPRLGRVVNGMAHRVDRLTALGDGQVSAVAAEAWHMLKARYGDSNATP